MVILVQGGVVRVVLGPEVNARNSSEVRHVVYSSAESDDVRQDFKGKARKVSCNRVRASGLECLRRFKNANSKQCSDSPHRQLGF